MFHRHGKGAKTAPKTSLKDLNLIATPTELLSTTKRQALVNAITKHSGLDKKRFDSLVSVLLSNFINSTQSLPETTNSYFSMPGGVIDYALNRTEAALELFRDYTIYDEGNKVSEIQKLWIYALLSASILQNIGKLQIDYHVDIFDNAGHCIKKYNPILEQMATVGSHYQHKFTDDNPDQDNLRNRVSLLLARMIMPVSGFSWIASDSEVLSVWLAMINGNTREAGTLGAILIRADAIAIQKYLNEYMTKDLVGRGKRGMNRISTFIDKADSSLHDQFVGAEFIRWLTRELDAGKLILNKAPLFMVPGGMLMSAEIFKLFVNENPQFKSWNAVQNGLLSLGLHNNGPDGSITSRFEQPNNQKMISGICIENFAAVLPDSVKVYNLFNGKIAPASAIEVIHMSQFNNQYSSQQNKITPSALQHLTSTGQWQSQSNSVAPFLRPGSMPYG